MFFWLYSLAKSIPSFLVALTTGLNQYVRAHSDLVSGIFKPTKHTPVSGPLHLLFALYWKVLSSDTSMVLTFAFLGLFHRKFFLWPVCLIIAIVLYPLTWLCFFHFLIFYYQGIDINISNINTDKLNEFCLFVYWLSFHTRTSAPWGQGYMLLPCPESLPLGILQGHGRYSINTCRMSVWDKFWLESVVSILFEIKLC